MPFAIINRTFKCLYLHYKRSTASAAKWHARSVVFKSQLRKIIIIDK